MFTFLFGPFLAVLPKRWRRSLPFLKSMKWRLPCILSGFGEFGLAIIAGQSSPTATQEGGYTETNLSSYVGAIREKVRVTKALSLPDELCVRKEGAEEFLEIRACRAKPDWTPSRTVKYQDTFYRLEGCSHGSEPRPFRYRLRRLSARVMGRTVLIYSPEQEPVEAEK